MYPCDDAEPFRKVYISRRKNYVKPTNEEGFVEEGFDTSRVGNEEAVEEYLKKYNWEIMYAEDFESVEDQVKYLRETKYLMGASSAGLINACFMKPGTNVIELLTTIAMWQAGGKLTEQRAEFHVLYTVMCWSLSIFHASIPNIKNEAALFEFIERNKHAKELVQNT
jgi:capsular polysaccharide biosynthesis protein